MTTPPQTASQPPMAHDTEPYRVIDISVPIHPNMPTFPGDPGVAFESVMVMNDGAVANVTMVHMGSQTGTHYDAPHHILNDAQTAEQIPLTMCFGSALVVELPADIQQITADVLAEYVTEKTPRLLLKTRNSRFWHESPNSFKTDFAAFTADGAQWLVDHGIGLIGLDYLSIELYGAKELGAHKAFLKSGVTILEGLDLTRAKPGWYVLSAFPLKYQGLDGAPCRAVLIQDNTS